MKIEFYFDHTGYFQKKIYFKVADQVWRDFEELTNEEVESIYCEIVAYSEKAHHALLLLSRSIRTGKRDILKQFIHCNWTVLDSKPDIGERILNYEAVPCPHKHSGNCPFSGMGTICIKVH